MALNINLLNLLLLVTASFIPLPYLIMKRIYSNESHLDEVLKNTLHYWLYFLLSILCLRLSIGILSVCTNFEFAGVGKYYPIRIAGLNYGLLQGLPYLLFCILLFKFIKNTQNVFLKIPLRLFILWVFSSIFLLSFGGIHGGLIAGNAWMAIAPEHLADANLNKTLSDVFLTHTDRVLGLIKPSYLAPHSTSHPAGSVAYWQAMTHLTNPFMFSFFNVLFFSLAFSVICWSLRRSFDDKIALQSVVACLFIPALLIYGRSDDVLYYALAAMIGSLLMVAINENKYLLTFFAGILFVCAMNLTYASVILLPAIFSFNANIRLVEIMQYIRRIIPHLLILIAIIFFSVRLEIQMMGFNWIEAFRASVQYNQGSNIFSLFAHKAYAEGINDRFMAVFDFLIFGGPLFLYLFISLIKNKGKNITVWKIKNIALVVLFCILAINSNGPGEISRPWGSLFLLIGMFWLPEFLNKKKEEPRWLLIQTQFVWSLLLQTFLNFGW